MSYIITRLTETKPSDFTAVIWNGFATLLKSREEKALIDYAHSLLAMLDFSIYCLMRVSSDSKEVAEDPYIYDALGRVLTHLTRHRRYLLNVIERKTGERPRLVKEAYEAYEEAVKSSRDMADFIAGARLCLRMLITAVRAGVYYSNDKQLRDVLIAMLERSPDYDLYMDEFLGRYVGEPDVYEPSMDVANIVLDICMRNFPHEPVEAAEPVKWIDVCGDGELPDKSLKSIIIDGVTEILLVKTEGRVYAVENICSHEGGLLCDGILESYSISCIDHLAKFDVRTGKVLAQPHHGLAKPQATFPTKIEDGRILVGLYHE